jgi:outer membrane protein assembly factor BamB
MEENNVDLCPRHEDEKLIAECINCGNRICRQCRDERGYFCSDECLAASRASVDTEAKEDFQKTLQDTAKTIAIVKTITVIVVLLLLACGGWVIWKNYLRPAGKIAWTWNGQMKANNFLILSKSDKAFTFKSGDSVISLDPATGKELKVNKVKQLGSYTQMLKKLDNEAVLSNTSSVAGIDLDGNILWQTSFDGSIFRSSAGNKILLVKVGKEVKTGKIIKSQFGDYEYKELKVSLHAIDMQTGKVLWRKNFNKEDPMGEFCADNGVFAYTSNSYKDKKYQSYLKVANAENGKDKWQIRLDNAASNPRIIGNQLIFNNNGNLCSVSLDGRKKLWNIKLNTFFSDSAIKVRDKYLFICGFEGIYCLDLETGHINWEKPAQMLEASYEYDNGKLFFIEGSFVEKKAGEEDVVKLPPTFEQLKDDDMFKNAFGNNMTKAKYVSKLVCLDAASGKQLWEQPKVRGEVVAQNNRLVIVKDTAQTTLLNLANGGKGMTILQEFDPETGKELVDKANKYGMMGPYTIEADKLIGLSYERVKSGLTFVTSAAEPGERLQGLAAFNLD